MHIICPNCGLKSPVEAGGLSVETRLVCTSCAVEFEIKFTDEPGAEVVTTEIALFEAFAEKLEEKLESQPAERSVAEACDVLELESLPAPQPAEGVWEQYLVLEVGQPVAPTLQPQPPAGDSLVNPQQELANPQEELVNPQQEDEDFEDVPETRPAHNFERAPAHAAQSFDKYNVGVRLMQASPVWLLVAGLSFICFIVLCNWFLVPANLAQAESPRPAAHGNHATNQSAGQSVAPSQPAEEMSDAREDAQPATQPAELSIQMAEQTAPEPTPALPPTPATAQTATPDGDTTSAPAAAAREKSAESSPATEAKFTLQVGSFNVAAEAEARASSLKAVGVEARVAQVEIPKRGTWYRVQAGRFATREEAERNGRQLREKGLATSYLTAALQ
ncbi:MAG: SPOR domain-containing protein [Rubrivivax sp.]|nr:SPOR domain-containing protein [Pyrinomonadaceae bacterium]